MPPDVILSKTYQFWLRMHNLNLIMKEHQNNQHSIFFKREWGRELLFFGNLNVVKKKIKRKKGFGNVSITGG